MPGRFVRPGLIVGHHPADARFPPNLTRSTRRRTTNVRMLNLNKVQKATLELVLVRKN